MMWRVTRIACEIHALGRLGIASTPQKTGHQSFRGFWSPKVMRAVGLLVLSADELHYLADGCVVNANLLDSCIKQHSMI